MKATYETADGSLSVEVEGTSQKAIFKGIAKLQEIFDPEACGDCGDNETRFRVRTVESNDYYEKVCNKCRAVLKFGQTKEGNNLFPKRKNADGEWEDNRGWVRWTPPTTT